MRILIIIALILTLTGCTDKKTIFLREKYFYDISYQDFMKVTPNLTNLVSASLIEDTFGNPSEIGTWSFKYNNSQFLIEGLTTQNNSSKIYCSTPISGNNYTEAINIISNHIGKLSYEKNGNFPTYSWKLKNISIGLYIDTIHNSFIVGI